MSSIKTTGRRQSRLAVGALAAVGLGLSSLASAFPLQLTQAGIDLGFTLDTIISSITVGGGPSPSCCQVLGSAVNSAGQIVVNNGSNGTNYLFNNVNNQTVANAISSASNLGGFPTAITNANGVLYASGSGFRRLNNDGSTAQTYAGISAFAGMWTNPVNQHVIAYGSATGVGSGLLDIDVSGPVPVVRLINGASTDGLTVSPDGQIVYTDNAAYRIDTGALVASYSVSGADGMGVIVSSNQLNGRVVVSTANNGTLVLMDPNNNYAQTVIATGGGYGDFTQTDPTTGTLLISSGNQLLRLGCGQGCGVGSGPVDPGPSVPEPNSLSLLGLALLGLGLVGYLKRRGLMA